ncbi:MAG TPA: hypothetical protein VGQ34_06435 [Sphingomicrobium sp.]|nr:hypothetical protein [Sphingomicrobium sp.]
MDLLERYLAEVRRNLPARDADDIAAELRDVLLERAEEQEEATGKIDWSSLLQEFGHPLVVAGRYRRQQWLIGPELYPFYLHFLKVIVTIVAAVMTGIAIVRGMLWGTDAGQIVASYLGSLWWAIASSVGSVTIVFAIIERFGGSSVKERRRWKPQELPEPNSGRPKLYESIFEVAFGALVLLWWLGVFPTPQLGGNFKLVAAPVWQAVFWPVAALMTSQLIFNLVRWLRPRWKIVRSLLGTVNVVAVLIIAGIVFRAGRWITVLSTGADQSQVASLQSALDLSFRIAIIVIVIVFTFNVAAELWRTARSTIGRRPGNGGPSSARA